MRRLTVAHCSVEPANPIVQHAKGVLSEAHGDQFRRRTLARILVRCILAFFASSSSPSQRSFQISLRKFARGSGSHALLM